MNERNVMASELIIVLKGEVACKKNSNKFNTRTKRTYKTDHFRKWHDYALLQTRVQNTLQKPFKRFWAEFTLYHGTLRRIDSDNQVTSLLDLLQDAKVIEDDCWTCCSHKTIDDVYRKGEAGAMIVLHGIE